MKQILQDLRNGETRIEEVPAPTNAIGNILIKTNKSVVSAGTERMLVNFGKANYIDKARQQPDKVKQVFNKVKTDGLIPTIEAVSSKLDQPLPLGYCNAGTVIDSDVPGFKIGDRVISNGNHSEIVRVTGNLCAKFLTMLMMNLHPLQCWGQLHFRVLDLFVQLLERLLLYLDWG